MQFVASGDGMWVATLTQGGHVSVSSPALGQSYTCEPRALDSVI